MSLFHRLAPLTLALAMAAATGAHAALDLRLQQAVPLKGAAPRWDYLSLDAARGHLFLGRRKEGVSVIDIRTNAMVGRVERSEGANIAAIASDIGRGYTANGDGTTTTFDLTTFKAIDRVKLGKSADAAFYEPVTHQVVFTLADDKELAFVDARTGAVTARVKMPAEELESVAVGGDGLLFVNERDVNKVAKVDARTHRLLGEWKIPGCVRPTGSAMDRERHRLFIGCRGDHPVLAVVNTLTGKLVASAAIGRANDGVVYDPASRRVFTANGQDANFVVFDQVSANAYKLAGVVTTRPWAKTLTMDPATGRVFTMTAEGMVDPAKKVNLEVGPFYPNTYFDDTFTLLIYGPADPAKAPSGGLATPQSP